MNATSRITASDVNQPCTVWINGECVATGKLAYVCGSWAGVKQGRRVDEWPAECVVCA